MQRRISSALISLLLLAPALTACLPTGDSGAAQAVRLYQVLPVARAKSALVQSEGEGEAVALINAGTTKHTVKDWVIQTSQGSVTLPRLELAPGQVIYLANDAAYFKQYWNRIPDYEYGVDADKAVPDLKVVGKAPVLADAGDLVKLLDEKGNVVDILAYGAVANVPAPWSGPTVELVDSDPVSPANQVITRQKQGDVLQIEPKAESWSGGTRLQPERVYYAGQSNFPVRKVSGPMSLTAASAPDNAGALLFKLVDEAEKSIRLTGYQFTNNELASRLIAAAERGVRVTLALERNPGGSEPDEVEKLVQQRLFEGGVEILYTHDWDGDRSTRFNLVQARYAIFDDETALVSTGDWTESAYSLDPTCGSREWMAVITGGPEVVNLFKEVWEFDFPVGHPEVRPFKAELDRPREPEIEAPAACFPYKPVKPQPLTVTGNVTLTRILSPDNTLDRAQGFLGLIRGAKQELLVSAASIDLWWGSAALPANQEQYPQPYLAEIVAAARRGVEVKVLLDRDSNGQSSQRDNRHLVQYLTRLAEQEKLKLEARLVNLDQSGIGRSYHNKSLVVDGSVVISSMDGSENAFRYARGMAIKVEGLPAFTNYYRDLFMHDWKGSERPNRPGSAVAVPLNDGTRIDWAANVELDVTGYEVYYKAEPTGEWEQIASVERPGYIDHRTKGIWGVVAVTSQGLRSNYAEVTR